MHTFYFNRSVGVYQCRSNQRHKSKEIQCAHQGPNLRLAHIIEYVACTSPETTVDVVLLINVLCQHTSTSAMSSLMCSPF